MTQPILQFDRISKHFFGVPALQSVSLSLKRGSLLGLIGENGAGKSTLMNILGGVIQPDAGRMRLNGQSYAPSNPSDAKRQGIAFIHQELNLFTNLSILDNLFIDGFPRLGRTPFIDLRRARQAVRKLLRAVGLETPPSTPVEHLTPGERQLVEIARALSQDARILIFDEPTTSLTAHESRRLFDLIGSLRAEGRTIVYISHNLEDVLRLTNQIAVLRDGSLVETGPTQSYTAESLIARMVGRDIGQRYPARPGRRDTEVVLTVDGLTQWGIVKDVCLTLHRGEILGVFGLMGSGRSELARILFGLDPFQTGSIRLAGQGQTAAGPDGRIRQGIAFVTENRREEGLLMDATVQDNLALVSLKRFAGSTAFIDRRGVRLGAERMTESLRIKAGRLDVQAAKHLSGGNQQKVVIGKWLLMDPRILILDEPTRGIDVGAKVEIYGIIQDLADKGTAILCICSELEELIGLCDRILVMSNGQIQGTFDRDGFDQEAILQAAFAGHQTRHHSEAQGVGS